MKFTLNTKPLSEGLDLGIINSNVSKYYERSTMAQIIVEGDILRVNLEAASIVSELEFKGNAEGSEGDLSVAFVDSMLLKQLVSTFETSLTTFEFTENGLVLHSGKSKFTLPYKENMEDIVDEDGELTMEFKQPSAQGTSEWAEVDKTGWKFVKDYQMYAISMSFFNKVYTLVYADASNNVIVGDFDNGLFTHSSKSNLNKTCLLTDTIVNLFNALPDGAKIAENDNNYLISVSTDSYKFKAEFVPFYESNPEYGSYNADLILDMMNSDVKGIKVNVDIINKILNQAALLSNASEDTIEFIVNGNTLKLKDKNIDCVIASETTSPVDYSLEFKTALFKPVISNSPDEEIEIRPLINEDEDGNDNINGILVISKDSKVALGGVEE